MQPTALASAIPENGNVPGNVTANLHLLLSVHKSVFQQSPHGFEGIPEFDLFPL